MSCPFEVQVCQLGGGVNPFVSPSVGYVPASYRAPLRPRPRLALAMSPPSRYSPARELHLATYLYIKRGKVSVTCVRPERWARPAQYQMTSQ